MQNHKEVLIAAEKVSYFKKDIRLTKEWACIQVHSFFGFDTFFSSMGEKLYAFLDIYKIIFKV
ncbi:hypothetical protein B7C51_14475 [Paenibacillus larvae subsp. pulvifaciens]|uniref:Uncharacterized protein n=1 Tax=Paenibacillus larvae subsp. pulvifaciens TaxID=1477 RepID=A0A1V0UU94_9BACL|nr:hypothetical protein B7C51_14475 [Paenibacillus larvae subsp. pulvifaciens]